MIRPLTRLTFSLRREWRNHTGNQGVDPLRILQPTTLHEVGEVVGSGGELYRIEPADGITDPAAFAERRPEWTLLQDDDAFNASRVAMGCLGVIYSVTLAVQPKFYLREVRTLTTWDEVREKLL